MNFMNWYYYKVSPRFRKYLCDYQCIDNIISVMYDIVTMRLFLMRCRLIWSCPVDLVFLSFDIANITSAARTCWGLHHEISLLVIREWVLSCLVCTSNSLVWCLCLTAMYVFSPVIAKQVAKGACSYGGFRKFHLFCFNFPGTSCFSRFQVS